MKNIQPPKLAQFLLRKIIASSICNEVLGDLQELFERRLKKKGPFVAKTYYYKDALLSIRNLRLRRKYKQQNEFAMYKNYFKVAYRNILGNKFQSLANTLSLSIGIASVLIIILFVQSELSFDNFHQKSERLYRLNKVVNSGAGKTKNDESSGLFGKGMVDEFPEVQSATRFEQRGSVVFTYKENSIKVKEAVYADANFFEVFDFQLKEGDKSKVLQRSSTVVLTEATAAAIFGSEDPIGKVVTGVGNVEYQVTGIADDPPKNSHIQFDLLISWETTVPEKGPLSINWMNNWMSQGITTYLLLKPEALVESVNDKLSAFEVNHIPDRAERYDFYLQPFTDIYLGSSDIQFSTSMTGTKFIYILSTVALAILLIAIFNYINISTSKATMRSKEVGVRKVVGARKNQLILQHLLESFIMVLIASGIGFLLAKIGLPFFNEFTSRSLSFTDVGSEFILTSIILVVSLAIISGIYPALIVSNFKSIGMAKSTNSAHGKGNVARQFLIGVQFIVTVVMIAATVIISRQSEYMQSVDLGYVGDNVLMTELSDAIYYNSEPFVNALKANKYTSDFTMSQQTPVMSNIGYSVYVDGQTDKEVDVRIFRTDERFIDFYQMEVLAGRNFNESISTDSAAVIINRTMFENTGWDDAIGKRLRIGSGPLVSVIGVVEDFNFRSLHSTVDPIVIQITKRPYNVGIKVSGNNQAEVIKALEEIWFEFEPREPISYSFLEQEVADFYKGENNVFKAIMIFAVISILISCFGLYGLTSHTVQRKFKEIGIRKVLGASEGNVILLINQKFIIIMLLSLAVSIPISYTVMGQWLESFAYRIKLDAFPFVLAIGITFAITMVTISIQTIKAARSNPVKALRTE
jgi:putative ABC transport system permease protein